MRESYYKLETMYSKFLLMADFENNQNTYICKIHPIPSLNIDPHGQVTPTLGDLTQIFPTFSNLILNLRFYTNADLKSTYLSNILQNSVELWTNL